MPLHDQPIRRLCQGIASFEYYEFDIMNLSSDIKTQPKKSNGIKTQTLTKTDVHTQRGNIGVKRNGRQKGKNWDRDWLRL